MSRARFSPIGSVATCALASALVLASCAAPKTPDAAIPPAGTNLPEPPPSASAALVTSQPIVTAGATGAVSTPISGPLVHQNASAAAVGRGPTKVASHNVDSAGDVTLNYIDADIREIVRLVLGNILHVNYSIDPGLQGTATIQTTRPLKQEELLPVLQTVLTQAGAMMTYEGGVFRIGPAGNTSVIPPVVAGNDPATGSQVVPLRYASAKQLAAMLEPYVGDGAKVLADPGRNVLVVTGAQTARDNVVDLIRVFDVDYLAGQAYALFPVKSGEPAKVAADLQHALQIDADGPLAGALKVVPLDRANAIMVISQSQAYVDRAAHLIDQIDQVSDSAGRTVHIYHVRNLQAVDLQPLLTRAFNPSAGAGASEGAPGSLAPSAEGTEVSGGGGTGAGAGGSRAGQGGAPGAQGASNSAGSRPLSQQTGFDQGGAQSGQNTSDNDSDTTSAPATGSTNGPRFIADKKSNNLLIVATDSEYRKIEITLRDLDVMPVQVLVEATIAEVTLNDALQYGVQFYLNSHGGGTSTILTNAATQTSTPTTSTTVLPNGTTVTNTQSTTSNSLLFNGLFNASFPGFALAKTVGDTQFALQALKDVTDVRVVSAPKLLILNNQKASLQVGDLVPIITQNAQSTSSAGAPLVSSVDYQPTGVILNVTPRVNPGGLVTLDIEQEVSQVVTTTSSTINSPTFQQRKVKSRIVVQDGETISLAGLISDSVEHDRSGVPLLQDIPLFGNLFSTHNNSTARTELIVLIKPKVLRDSNDARVMTEELRRQLIPSSLAPWHDTPASAKPAAIPGG